MKGPDVMRHGFARLKGKKMATMRKFSPADDVSQIPLSPDARGWGIGRREQHGMWHVVRRRLLHQCGVCKGFLVEPDRSADGLGKPINAQERR
jgi:hypothetical protein